MLERIIAIFILIVFMPVIALLIGCLIFDSGPIFYRQQRVGKGGKAIYIYKFRSMVVGSDRLLKEYLGNDPVAAAEWAIRQKLRDDPRVTRLGRFIRKYSLDELPQLISVLKGDMSLVGPRPVGPGELLRYGASRRHYLRVRPGLTGVWQVMRTDQTTYSRRVAYDRAYVANANVCWDIKIIAMTVLRVLAPRGAH